MTNAAVSTLRRLWSLGSPPLGAFSCIVPIRSSGPGNNAWRVMESLKG